MSPEAPVEEQRKRGVVPTIYIVGAAIAILAVVALLVWIIVWAAQNRPDQVEVVRDVFIIALALESCLFGIVLMLLLIMVMRLVNTLEFEIKPILQETQETIGTVRGTTTFVSRNVVRPVVSATSYAAGVRRGLRALFGDPRRNLPD